MIRLALGLAIIISTAFNMHAEQDGLTTLSAIASISNSEAQHHMQVAFEATVTYYGLHRVLFVQDGESGIYVAAPDDLNLVPGDRILVRGEMRPSFRPYVVSHEIKLLGHGLLPKPVHATFDQMVRSETDSRLVTIRAKVRAVDRELDPRYLRTLSTLHLLMDGESLDALTDKDEANTLGRLLGAEVEVTGVSSGVFDNKMQLTGVLIHFQSPSDVKVLKLAQVDPWSIPLTQMDRVIISRRIDDESDRVRVRGTVTYYDPGQSVVLQDGQKSIRVLLGSTPDLRVGDLADAIGFPDLRNGFLTLTQGEVRDERIQSPVTPVLSSWRDLAIGGNDGIGHIFDLVSIDGQVETEVRQATQDEYVIKSDGHLLSAILRHPGSTSRVAIAPMRWIPIGSRIRVTGICMQDDANPFNGEVPFNILMRSADDIEILKRPPWLDVAHLLDLIAALLVALVLLGARGWFIEHRSRRRTIALALMEQRRSRILEDVNSSRPLAEILEKITELVSFSLRGAPCWCEVEDCATSGNRPADLQSHSWQIFEQPVQSHSGTQLGTIFAALPAHAHRVSHARGALRQGAALASLAIETSRLHSDLVHRSEYDLLTDVPNRFNLERALDQMIAQANRSKGMFGLIYIDLNDFKQVNDRYGHLAGDTYLREAAERMKHQLRPGDVLARLGGDEFAVLVPDVRSRTAVQEVAARLEECFGPAFQVGEAMIAGTASIGFAVYPEDGITKDGLLTAADTSMYKVKSARHRTREQRLEHQRTGA